ncbi:protein SRG1-like isoform X1 [Cryptomeria japonica]|uniref:protein SRG1-like isoform X1 n=2 Tax=Cryptomeria japonica TaxID=3369 RepID=UPI0027D9EFA7|nr:protein SRG1-like isoform X1 [Cryptomeria japonica]
MDLAHTSSKMANWGNPLLKTVNVQEIAREQPQIVPERYMRSDEERPGTLTTLPVQLSIPIIDMANLSQGGLQRKEELCKIAKACEEWGFFQVVNHNIRHSLLDDIKRVEKEFFHLPLEEKQKCALRDFQGYGQIFVVSEDQKLDWGDLLGLIISPPQNRNLSLWPAVPADFRHTVDEYNKEIKSLAAQLQSLIAETLHLKTDYFEHSFGNTYQKMRMNYYPPCPKPDHVLGLSPHADGSGITLLLQDDEVEGLHIRKDDKWVAVQPIPYALVVNIGFLLEVMSNGRYRSIEHRAVTSKENARLSIATFYSPGFDAEICPAPQLIDENHPCLFKKFIHEDFIRHHMSRKIEGKKSFYEYAGITANGRK